MPPVRSGIPVGWHRDALGCERACNGACRQTAQAHGKDAMDQRGFVGIHAPTAPHGVQQCIDSQRGRATPGMPGADTPHGATSGAFEDFGTLILGERTAHLKEEPAFRAVFNWMGDNAEGNAGAASASSAKRS